jgi:tetratricopeptide (TPR) repeat protein
MRLWLVVSLALIPTSAFAQHHGHGGGTQGTNPTGGGATGTGAGTHAGGPVHGGNGGGGAITFSLDRSRNAAADLARARAAAGDCKGALDLFDEALRRSIDVTLYRDRGSCHEKLGDVYPAIDDYRAYVSQAPDAPDAEKIRERLDSLIKDASQDMAPNLGRGGDFASEMRGGMTDGSTPEAKPRDATIKGDDESTKTEPADTQDKSLTSIEYEEGRDKQADHGALRKGKGVVLGVFLWPRYVITDYTFQFGQGVAVRLGYSFSSTSTISAELGYMDQLSTGSASSLGGFTGTLNYEFRLALDRWADNQLVFTAGAGYENLTRSDLGLTYSSFIGRGRFGYRHVFGPALALDIAADGGLMITLPNDPPPMTETAAAGAFIGGIVALSVGF